MEKMGEVSKEVDGKVGSVDGFKVNCKTISFEILNFMS